MCLNHLPSPRHLVSWVCHKSAVSGVPCLLWGANLWLWPSWQISTVQVPRKTWSATGSLITVWWRMPSVGLKLPLPSSSGYCMPAFLPLAGGCLVRWYSFSPLFCEWAGLCLRLEFCTGKFSLSFFFKFLWLSHSLGCYLTLAPLDCPLGIQAWSLL